MLKRTLLAVLAGAALLTACKKEKGNDVIPVSFSSFGFTAVANANYLKTDNIIENPTSEALSFTLPYGTDPDAVSKLVPSFVVTEGASVSVGDAEVVSGETVVDFSSEVQFVISLKNNYKAYTVSVKIAEPAKWAQVAESDNGAAGDPALTINPKDGVPYVMGAMTYSYEDETGATKSRKEPHLFKFESVTLMDMAGALAEVDSKCFAVDFNPEGVPYVSFYDGTLAKQSVMKVTGVGEASYVGEAGQMFKTGTGANSSVAVFPISDNDVWCAQRNDDRNVVVARRSLNLAHFDGSAWTNNNQITGRTAADYAYCVLGRIISGVPYMYVYNQNSQSISIYKYSDNAWTTMFESLKIKQADGQTDATLDLYAMDFDIASDGSVYVMTGADYSTTKVYNIGVVRISADGSSQQIIGGEMTEVNIDKYRNASMSLDANDVPYVVYTKPDAEGSSKHLFITYIDSKTKTWAPEEALGADACDFAVIRFSESGVGYVAATAKGTSADDPETTFSKYVLYSSAQQ